MYNIIIIFSMHKEIEKCNSNELYNIINKINPDVIFEEFDILRNEDEFFRNGYYKYQENISVETKAIMQYLENNSVAYVPVDTYELENPPEELYLKISNFNEEYGNIVKLNFILSFKHGFPYINSNECSELIEKINKMEENIVYQINDDNLIKTFNDWKLITNNRDYEMINNIYEYSKNNIFNKAVFVVGADHKISILNKINEYRNKEKLKLNWFDYNGNII